MGEAVGGRDRGTGRVRRTRQGARAVRSTTSGETVRGSKSATPPRERVRTTTSAPPRCRIRTAAPSPRRPAPLTAPRCRSARNSAARATCQRCRAAAPLVTVAALARDSGASRRRRCFSSQTRAFVAVAGSSPVLFCCGLLHIKTVTEAVLNPALRSRDLLAAWNSVLLVGDTALLLGVGCSGWRAARSGLMKIITKN